jgi:hypothetical protein
MSLEEKKAVWTEVGEDVLSGMIEWRVRTPKVQFLLSGALLSAILTEECSRHTTCGAYGGSREPERKARWIAESPTTVQVAEGEP